MQMLINKRSIVYYIMATIIKSVIKREGKEYVRYNTQLPKDQMDRLEIESGDQLTFVRESKGMILFKIERKACAHNTSYATKQEDEE